MGAGIVSVCCGISAFVSMAPYVPTQTHKVPAYTGTYKNTGQDVTQVYRISVPGSDCVLIM